MKKYILSVLLIFVAAAASVFCAAAADAPANPDSGLSINDLADMIDEYSNGKFKESVGIGSIDFDSLVSSLSDALSSGNIDDAEKAFNSLMDGDGGGLFNSIISSMGNGLAESGGSALLNGFTGAMRDLLPAPRTNAPTTTAEETTTEEETTAEITEKPPETAKPSEKAESVTGETESVTEAETEPVTALGAPALWGDSPIETTDPNGFYIVDSYENRFLEQAGGADFQSETSVGAYITMGVLFLCCAMGLILFLTYIKNNKAKAAISSAPVYERPEEDYYEEEYADYEEYDEYEDEDEDINF
ncbi:MAG: hypothetical protein FWF08_04215 [Oscillospiraceae bacterium]|nr:hypothetical protein [Oscillospiraceae bacterium]